MEASSRGNVYVKQNGHWVIASGGYDAGVGVLDSARERGSAIGTTENYNERMVSIQIVLDKNKMQLLPLPFLRNIQGTGPQRKTHESVSSALEKLQFEEYANQYRQYLYCLEFYRLLIKHKCHRLSGTVQKHVCNMLEQMTSTAISLELFVPSLKQTLRDVHDCLRDKEQEMIGSKAMRRKNQDMVSNCLVRVSNFQYTQKEEDGTLSLMDLPKECLINILKKLEKPRDIINVAMTCSTLEVIAMDTEVWESMCFHHFNDKEICDYVGHMELYSVNWVEVFKFCLKKSKVLKTCYGDELVVCNNCRGVCWRRVGHDCISNEVLPSFTALSPADFLNLLNL